MEKKLQRLENIQLHEFVAILLRNQKIEKKYICYIKIIIDDIVAPPPWQPSDFDFGKIFNF